MKLLCTVLLAITALFSAACRSDESDLPPVGYDQDGNTYDPEDFGGPAAPSPSSPAITDEGILAYVVMVGREIPGRSETELIALGRDVCASLDAAQVATGQELASLGLRIGREEGLTPAQSGSLMGGAVVTFCDEYWPLVQEIS